MEGRFDHRHQFATMKNTGHPASSWYAVTKNRFDAGPPISGETVCDVAIVGGG